MRRLVFCTAFFAVLLSGCARFQSPGDYWINPQQAKPSGRAGALLLYADYVRGLPAGDYARELDHVRQLAAEDKSQFRQLQYVLALSAPGGDIRKAQQVIEIAANASGNRDPELVALANMLSADLAERRRLEASARRAGELEKKVEAVKEIEKNMIGRDKP